jgi:uncharacterized protein (TIGR00255 family)
MIRSMTGFGSAKFEDEQLLIKAEIKSLNNKFTEINIRIPKILQPKELALRSMVSTLAERGSLSLSIVFQFKNQTTNSSGINKELLKNYLTELKSVATDLEMEASHLLSSAYMLPEVLISQDMELSEGEWNKVQAVLNEAFKAFDEYRKEEGKAIEKVLLGYIRNISSGLVEVEMADGERLQKIKERIKTNLEAFIPKEQIDPARFEQELIYYIEKLDVSEEKSRLAKHCSYFNETTHENNPGKKLGFIAQEIGREINTIGSKANDFNIQQLVVGMKDELEKVKEQIMNVV